MTDEKLIDDAALHSDPHAVHRRGVVISLVPGIPDETRARSPDQAVECVRAVGEAGGTMTVNLEVEFARADARVRRGIRRNTERALRRIDEGTPFEIRDGIRKPPGVEAFESFGAAAIFAGDAIATFIDAIAPKRAKARTPQPGRHQMTTVPTKGIHPTYAHPDDAGADLRALKGRWITPNSRATIRTGTSLAIPAGHFGLVAGRSGLGTKHGIALVNGIGVIDAGYRGEIQVGLINHGKQPFEIKAGDRIAQLVIVPFITATFEAVEDLDDTDRGDGGFGSTGVAA